VAIGCNEGEFAGPIFLPVARFRQARHQLDAFRRHFDFGALRAGGRPFQNGAAAFATGHAELIAVQRVLAARDWLGRNTGAITLGQMTMYVMLFRQGQAAVSASLAAIGGMYEDNLYLSKGVKATNGQLTAKAKEIIELLGARVLTPGEGRDKLGLRPRS
jgi:uncharacterized protein (DUF849 family)